MHGQMDWMGPVRNGRDLTSGLVGGGRCLPGSCTMPRADPASSLSLWNGQKRSEWSKLRCEVQLELQGSDSPASLGYITWFCFHLLPTDGGKNTRLLLEGPGIWRAHNVLEGPSHPLRCGGREKVSLAFPWWMGVVGG